jgi:hypothetical protein
MNLNYVRIFYFVYVFYILILLFDWQVAVNSDYLIYYALYGLLIILFLTLLCTSLYIDGRDPLNLGFTSKGWTITIVVIITLLLAVLYYQYSVNTALKSSITNKVRRNNFQPLQYEYGVNSDIISHRLHVDQLRMTMSLDETWEYFMSNKSNADRILSEFFTVPWIGPPDVTYNLLWPLTIAADPCRNLLTRSERAYLQQADHITLQEMVGPHYKGTQDRASLLFAILSGQTVNHELNNPERYDLIKTYDPALIYNLTFSDKLIDKQRGKYSLQGPYVYLANSNQGPIESIIQNINPDNMADTAEKLGLEYTPDINRIENKDYILNRIRTQDILGKIKQDVSSYHHVFNRPEDIGYPPDLRGLTREDCYQIMLQYTNLELIESYEPRLGWNNRRELLNTIYQDVNGIPRWSIKSTEYCSNDDTINVMSGDEHGSMDKHDRQDPTLSYGVQRNYRCYQASELEASFNDFEGMFLFRVPDWRDGSDHPREFTLSSMIQLKELLEKEQIHYNVKHLLQKVTEGITILKSVKMYIQNMKGKYNDMNEEQKETINLYLCWMFCYAMWMRFWKGQEHPWPLKSGHGSGVMMFFGRALGMVADRATPEERDQHIFIQEGVRTAIVELYEDDEVVKNWIDGLATIYYDFESREASCASHAIKDTMDKVAIGDYCMGFASDTILKTAYYYITELLDCPEGMELDNFISKHMNKLLDLEYNVIAGQLDVVNQGERLNVLRSRMRSIQNYQGRFNLTFDSKNYQNNVHVNN